MQEKLVAFIRQQIKSGHDINSIKNHLLGVGYHPGDINSAIAFVTGGADESIKQKIMPFISQQKHLGYDENTVRTHLIKSGYPAEIVNKAVKEGYEEHAVAPKISRQNFAIIGGIAVVLIAVIGIIMLFTGGEEEQAEAQLLDFEIDALTQSVNRGDELEFNLELTSMGSFKRYDMQITHKIYNQDGKAITFKKETVAIETKVSKTTTIPVPLTAPPGTYRLESVARYNGLTAEASLEFEIQGKDEPDETGDEPEPEDVPIAEGEGEGEAESEGEAEAEGEGEAEGELPDELPEYEGKVALEDIEDDVKKYSAQPGKDKMAANLCELLEQTKDKDTCYLTIVEISRKKSYCEKIQSEYRKDICYLSFSREGDYTVCDSMQDEDLKVSCKALAERSGSAAEGEGEGEPINITNATITNATATNITNATLPGEGEGEGEGEPEPITLQEMFEQVSEIANQDVDAAKSLCANLTTEYERDQCYIIILNVQPDTGLCLLMSTSLATDQCYLNYVVKTRDESACDQITDNIVKNQCERI